MEARTLILALALLAALSCRGHAPEPPAHGGAVRLEVTVCAGATKAARTPSQENTVNGFWVALVRNGAVVDQALVDGTSATLTAPRGTGYRLMAVANMNSVLEGPYGAGSDMLAWVEESLLLDLAGTVDQGFAMYGSLDGVVVDGTAAVELPLRRAAAKITCDNIINDSGSNFSLRGAFLLNVPRYYSPFGATPYGYASCWYNRRADGMAASDPLYPVLYLDAGGYDFFWGDESLTAFSTMSPDAFTFYSMPNPTVEDSHDEAWCPRHTRLAIDLYNQDTAEHGFIAITLPQFDANQHLHISGITIRRWDNYLLNPDDDKGDPMVTCQVSVLPWDETVPLGARTL